LFLLSLLVLNDGTLPVFSVVRNTGLFLSRILQQDNERQMNNHDSTKTANDHWRV
jgi:hypothetical protein